MEVKSQYHLVFLLKVKSKNNNMSFKKNILKNKETSSEFKKNSFKNKNNDNGDSDKYVSAAKGYNPKKEYEEHYFQSLLETARENPMPERGIGSGSELDREIGKILHLKSLKKHTKSLYKKASTKAKQKQIIDYRKKSLTLKKKK